MVAMYVYDKPEAIDEVIVLRQVALPFKPEEAETRKGVMLNASEPKVKSKDDEKNGVLYIHDQTGL